MDKVFGRTQGLKKSELKRISNLYRRRLPKDRVLTPELAHTLAALSAEVGRPLSLVLDREGRVVRVAVGDAKDVPFPEEGWSERRLSGYRLLHPPGPRGAFPARPLRPLPQAAGQPGRLGGGGGRAPGPLHLAFLSPPRALEEDWRVLPPKPFHQYLDLDLWGEVMALEEELSRQARVLRVRDGSGERALLVGVDTGEGPEAEAVLRELAELTRTAGGVPVRQILVFRKSLDPRYLVGLGKLEELKSLAYHENASTLIFGVDLTPAQAREIERVTGLKVLDRTQLILDIFALHAKTPEAQAQVELAQLRYLLPRLVGKGKEMSRLGGGIGTRGPGETKLEVDRRRLQDRIAHLSRKLQDYALRRQEARQKRKRRGVPLVAVVGYTNAGKTTLLRALTRAGEEGEDKLFATLRPLTRRGFLPGVGEVLFTDTVGFIRHMPEELLTAFRATLEEVRRRTSWSTSWTPRRRGRWSGTGWCGTCFWTSGWRPPWSSPSTRRTGRPPTTSTSWGSAWGAFPCPPSRGRGLRSSRRPSPGPCWTLGSVPRPGLSTRESPLAPPPPPTGPPPPPPGRGGGLA